MVCPNCQSRDLVTVDQKQFCTACGQLIPITRANGTKKRPVGRPPKPRLDVARPRPVVAQVAPRATQVAPLTVAPTRSLDTLRIVAPPTPAAVQPTLHPLPGLLRSVWEALAQPVLYVQALPLALASLVPVALLYLNWPLAQTAWVHWPASLTSSFAGQLGLVAAFIWLIGVIVTGAIAYGSARLGDHRAEASWRWIGLGLRATWPAAGLIILNMIIGSAIIMGTAAAAYYGAHSNVLPALAAQILIFVAALIGADLAAGVLIATSLGLTALVLSDLSGPAAWRFGWQGFIKHFELVAGWLAVLIGWAVAIGLVAWLSQWVAYTYAPSAALAWGLISLAVFVLTILVSIQAGVGAEAAYRHVVVTDQFSRSGQLLLGRKLTGRSFSLIFPTLLGIALAVGIITWQVYYIR